MLPEDHTVYSNFNRSLYNLTLSNLVREIEHLNLCIGITQPDPSYLNNFHKLFIPRKFDFSAFNNDKVFTKLNQDEYNRTPECYI